MLGTFRPRRLSRFEVEPGGYTPERRELNGAAGDCGSGAGGSGRLIGGVRRAGRVVARRLPAGARTGPRGRTRACAGVAAPATTSIAPIARFRPPLRIVLS